MSKRQSRRLRQKLLAAGGAGLAVATAGIPGVVGIAGAQQDAPDPEVIALREAASQAGDYTPPEPVELSQEEIENPPMVPKAVNRGYLLRSANYKGGYVQTAADDWAKNDSPGFVTTTLRIWGNAATWRDGNGPVKLTSQFTCTGVGISGVTVSTGGVSVTGGADSKTATWTSSRTNTREVRQSYEGDGHFRCKATNLSLAKTTRRGIGIASYKTTDVRTQAEYSFWW